MLKHYRKGRSFDLDAGEAIRLGEGIRGISTRFGDMAAKTFHRRLHSRQGGYTDRLKCLFCNPTGEETLSHETPDDFMVSKMFFQTAYM